ncbi:NAD(P)-binding protein [Aspergillus eucalypticola CBS 122712]|uniref:NAD(P)-binding protein n=1 Tax=Aspergillus eucalypticola (strain CBS 122712 / IBT 29274) TaxID=1448314 RepID=A0A317VAA6_ASPEC|nr:NAD(P)-binding protein [Aspergillus eucalypticola CBS 122712]PWY69967.1 NAD(P)-binding protein [Aspergillus eucalypticola CBS 122712]
MTVSSNRSIAIIGVGSTMSRSLALWLASVGWNIALVSRSENSLSKIADEVKAAQTNADAKVIYRTADAGNPDSLTSTLDWCAQQFGGKLDVLNYNAARVAPSHITKVTPEELNLDLQVSAVGTLVAGQWFTRNANTDNIPKGEWPLFLVTGGTLDREPQIACSSLSAAKAASQTISRLFAQTLPQEARVVVGMPLIRARIVDPETGGYTEGYHPDTIIQTVFKPFFEDREKLQGGVDNWAVERII